MKTIFISAIIVLTIAMPVKAQLFEMKESQVPTSVKETFHKKYANTEVRQWKHKKNEYTARFSINRKKHEAVFNSGGDWVNTEINIKWEELPSAVRKSFWETDFKWLNRESVKIIETPGKEKLYLIEGDNMNIESDPICKFKLWFSEDGVMLKKDSDC